MLIRAKRDWAYTGFDSALAKSALLLESSTTLRLYKAIKIEKKNPVFAIWPSSYGEKYLSL